MARFTSFVVLAEMRTGSNFLEANLNAIPGVACHGELFNPVFVGRANLDAMFGVDLPTRNADPLAMLAAMRAGPGLNGFRLFHDHDPRVTAAVLADPTCAKVVLTRNLAESYVSLLIARETGQWKLTQAKRLKQAKVTFDAAEFTDLAERLQAQQVLILRQLQVTGQTAFWLDYEDIGLLEVMNGLAAYLGVEGRLSAIDSTLKVQNPEPLRDKVTNPEAMEAALARMDRFNLSRTPNFEPRRAAAVPSFVAAGPLLHMPLRGGPDAAVTEWMAGIGPVHGDFNARTLRGWRQAHPQGRSFTVLRDPALRAWGAYGDRVLTGARADVWQAITRDLKLPVPAPGLGDAVAIMDGFRGFLRFVKLNLSGQMPQRVDATWASQLAILQGFAGHQTPDLVLREDDLPNALARLADDTDVSAPPYTGTAPTVDLPDDIRAMVRDIYAKDYGAFGFA